MLFFRISFFYFFSFSFFCTEAFSRNWNEIKKSGILKACCVPWMGLDAADELRIGPDCELFKAFAVSLNLKPEIVVVEWPKLFESNPDSKTKTPRLLANQTCDLYSTNLGITPSRLEALDMEPYYSSRIMILYLKGSAFRPRRIEDLYKRKTAVVPGTTLADWVDTFNKNETRESKKILVEYIPRGGSLKLLETGKIDFAVVDASQALFASARPNSRIAWAFPVGGHSGIGWAFEKNNSAEIRSHFGSFIRLQKSTPNSSLNTIFLKYFSLNVSEFESLIMSGQ